MCFPRAPDPGASIAALTLSHNCRPKGVFNFASNYKQRAMVWANYIASDMSQCKVTWHSVRWHVVESIETKTLNCSPPNTTPLQANTTHTGWRDSLNEEVIWSQYRGGLARCSLNTEVVGQGVVCIERWSEWRGPWSACDVPLVLFSLLPPPALVSCPPLHPSSFALLSSNPSCPVTHGGSLLLLQNCLKLSTVTEVKNKEERVRRSSTTKGANTNTQLPIYMSLFLSAIFSICTDTCTCVPHTSTCSSVDARRFSNCVRIRKKKRDTA